jgi:hypothetical protein
MNSIWDKVYDPVKDRRYGMLFFISLVALFCVFILGRLAWAIWTDLAPETSELQIWLLLTLLGISVFTSALICRELRSRRDRCDRKEMFERQELSRDEIIKARSKLVKARK